MPDTGPAIIASNHLSFSDSIFMPLMVKRKVTFVAKAEYFTGKGIKGWLIKMFFVGTGTIPVDRSGGRAAQAALDTQLRVLREGNAGRHLPGGHPVAGRPAVPGQDRGGPAGAGERRAGDPGGDAQRRRDPAARQDHPEGQAGARSGSARRWTSPGTPGMAGDRFVERAVTDEIMYELMELSGREYVDVYAQKVKTQQAKAMAPGRSHPRPSPRSSPSRPPRGASPLGAAGAPAILASSR